ncbi:MAG: hypothetical protein WC521_07870 [Bdellovibrionales bacterium]
MNRHILSLLAFSLIVCFAGTPAFAKKPHHPVQPQAIHDNGVFEPEGRKNWGRHGDDFDGVAFDDDERGAIRAYLSDEHHRKCPPGLAKKNKRCMPPGQSKKYEIGGMLPRQHSVPPRALLERLGPPPAGTFYSMVDRDVLIASEATKKILDAVTLFSAIQ